MPLYHHYQHHQQKMELAPVQGAQKEYIDEYYLAYGSNLNMHDMKERCPDAHLVDRFLLKGYKLAFRGPQPGRSYLTLLPAAGCEVPVALWKISVQDKTALDLYEDCPDLYEIHAMVLCGHPCFTYLMKPIYPYVQPSEEYIECVKQGYRDMGFDKLHLKCAYE